MRVYAFLLFSIGCASGKPSIDTSSTAAVLQDADGDGFYDDEDCDDSNPQIYPSAEELCDGLDNNCSGEIDEDVLRLSYADSDGDGFGNPDIFTEACEIPSGFVATGSDCDDTNDDSYPGATEICDEEDNDCDDVIDNGIGEAYFLDLDGDGFGDESQVVEACDLRAGISSLGGDCDDENVFINPLAAEICDEMDNNCDGAIDENQTTTFYVDFDSDGYGALADPIEACTLPEGYVENSDDCDDLDSVIHPESVEICDTVDNNCDGVIDEESAVDAPLWYDDGDSDNYGDPNDSLYSCSAPSGYVTDNTDCNDNDENIHPTSAEECDGVDNDCDGDIDEEGAIDADTWYFDGDSDGFGEPTNAILYCSQPIGYVADGTDCDDNDDDVNPQGTEECNGEDDNCDGVIDEDSALDAPMWYADTDEDGFGDVATSMTACTQPSNFVSNATDCDDTLELVFPNASELCNGFDDDCDGDTDEYDAIDQVTWYADADSDGYGSINYTTEACQQPSGYVSDDRDCNDLDDAINPLAQETCDGIDNDCDDDIDDADADLETSNIWYADTDADGQGDPNVTTNECLQPIGYVDNGDDCDDSSASDIDGDGTQDCADDDSDGDQLPNDMDIDPLDPSIVRTPKGGTGYDGDFSVSGSGTQADWTLLDGGETAGNSTITVLDSSAFQYLDELLILSQQGADAGIYEMVFVTSINGNSLGITPPLNEDYDTSSTVLVQRIPHYQNVDISGVLSPSLWGGMGGGVVIFRAAGTVAIDGSIEASGFGYQGGAGVYGNGYDPIQGESYQSLGQSGNTSANDGGGGAYPRRSDNSDGGGGGSYGSAGTAGVNYFGAGVTSPGDTYGSADLNEWFLGSGGGGGSPDTEGDGVSTANYSGDGGSGGGSIIIFSSTSIAINGSIVADGDNGDDSISGSGECGGGGGGSGGQIYLGAPEIEINGMVRTIGGIGGIGYGNSGQYGSAQGGSGGEGRIRLDYNNLSGTAGSSVGYTTGYVE